MTPLQAKAGAYFQDASAFLAAFAEDPHGAIATLTVNPRAYGLRRPELGAIERDSRFKALLVEARRSARLVGPS